MSWKTWRLWGAVVGWLGVAVLVCSNCFLLPHIVAAIKHQMEEAQGRLSATSSTNGGPGCRPRLRGLKLGSSWEGQWR